MPELTGPEAYSQMCSIKPGLPVVFTTGHRAESVSLTSTIDAGAVFLEKPYLPEALSQAVRKRLDGTAK
jgi:FixJ family two-component response regulator